METLLLLVFLKVLEILFYIFFFLIEFQPIASSTNGCALYNQTKTPKTVSIA